MAVQSRSHNLPSISSCEYCWGIVSAAAMRATGCSHGEAETGFQGGWRHVDKHTIGDGLGRAGVTKDELSERSVLVDLKLLMAILNPAKRRQAFCVPKGWRGQGRPKGGETE